MLAGLDRAQAYLDSILIESETRPQDIKIVFERIKEYGFRINETRCELFMSRIKYLGQVIAIKVQCPDPAWSSAIKDMPAPTNWTKLQTSLGFANYYHVYIPNMHELTAPLNTLLKKDTK